MRNLKITISFDGTEYSGWQRQDNAVTIQGEIEKELSRICNNSIMLHGAGRTDAGVHALAMTANFETASTIGLAELQKALNSLLPPAIRIIHIEEVDTCFHSRFATSTKTYLYNIDTSAIQSPMDRLYRVHIQQKVSISDMEQCLATISGTHDFASFEANGSRDKSITGGRGSVRTIHTATLNKTGENFYQFEITGDGFLRHMVRNIVGTILDVGKGRTTRVEFKKILAANDRSVAGATAPAHGLFLKWIDYI